MRDQRRIVKWASALAALLTAFALHGTLQAAESETAKADAARKKPLQRCDQLSDKAELECLHKARERIVQARSKREGAAAQRSDAKASTAVAVEQKAR